MENIVVADKATAQVTAQSFGNVALQNPAVVQIPVPPEQVASVSRSGDDAVLNLKNGEHVRVSNFFKVNPEGVQSDMVFQGQDGTLWQAQYDAQAFHGFTFAEVSSIDDLLAGVAVVGSATPEWAIAGLGLLGAGGATAAAVGTGGGGGGGSDSGTAADTTAPDAPTGLSLSPEGLTLSGLGEAGAAVTVRDAAGNVLGTGTVGADGTFQVPLNSAQNNGQTLDVTLTDGAGNVSAPGTVTAADTSAPAAPDNLALGAEGLTLTGTGEIGSTVNVRDAAGTLLGTAVVGSDGSFQVSLSQAQANGQTLNVTLTDAAGNTSAPGTVIAADTTAPDAPTNLIVSADGSALTGSAEAGSTVTVKDADGNVLGTALVASDGTFSVTLAPPQTQGQTLTVSDTDPAGNVSPPVNALAPVEGGSTITLPAPTDVAISGTGTLVTGHGEVGSTATVIDGNGTVLGTAAVGSDGLFSITISPAQDAGQVLQVTLSDSTGNLSPNVALGAPDTTPPAQPTNLALSTDGVTLTGTAEAGARILVRLHSTVIGIARVNVDGTFSVTLTSAQTNGQHLDVSVTDAAGNSSAPEALTAPDTTLPDNVTNVVISADGLTVSGQGEVGATVTVLNLAGTAIASGVVGVNGTFNIALQPAVVTGDILRLSQADAAGNSSANVAVIAPSADGPGTPADLAVNADGSQLTGTGTPGNAIEVLDPSGTVVGVAVVDSNGTFTVNLLPNQANGEVLSVIATDSNTVSSVSVPVTAPDITGPAAATDLVINANGLLLTGRGEAGATVTVKNTAGTVLGTAVVSDTGSFAVTLNSAQIDGQALHVTLNDTANNTSPIADISAPDLDGPLQPGNLSINTAGTVLSGVGEAGSLVTVRTAGGTVLGTATVTADGTFHVTLSTAQHNGQTLTVAATDSTGTGAGPVSFQTPDTQAPAPLTNLVVGTAGDTLTGNGEIGANVIVRDPSGNVIGTAVVDGNGQFTALLTTTQINAQVLQVVQTDPAGNPSTPATATAPDLTPPAAITDAVLSSNGLIVTGHGEVGATVTVNDAGGNPLGTGVVASNGLFQVNLGTAQLNGQTLTVLQTDVAGNPSTGTSWTVADIQAPSAPTLLSLNDTGDALSGTGEVGATVHVYAQDGSLLGNVVITNTDGTFTVPLSGVQADGQLLHVNQTDTHNNVSADASYTAPDTTAPGSLTALAISANGATVTGLGVAGDTVYVHTAGGVLLGSAVVAGNGTFSVTLTPPQLNGETLDVHQEDASQNASPTQTVTALDLTAPTAPTDLAVNATGTHLTGVAEAGSTVRVTDANGNPLGNATADGTGAFDITLTTAQTNGQGLLVTASDALYTSLPGSVNAPDTTPPADPSQLTLTPDGSQLSGLGEAGTTITVRDSANTVLGTTTVASNGSFVVTLSTPAASGSTLTVTGSDAAGNTSGDVTVSGPDGTQVATPADLALSSDGTVLTGTGTAGTTVTVTDNTGAAVGSAVVDSTGHFRVLFSTAKVNAQTLHVTATDGSGHTSVPVTVVAGDTTAPDAPTDLAVAANGSTLSGKGEVGATVSVADASGAVVGSAVVASNGTFVVVFTTAQANGQALTVTQSDAAANVSQPASTVAPDIQAPAAASGLSINNVGTVVSGLGEAGANVSVRNASGTEVGTGIVDQSGHFQISLTQSQTDGGALRVTLTDAAGNASPIASLTTVDTTPPAAVSGLTISQDGGTLNGTGEPGATVQVTSSTGVVLGTATVASNGSFSVSMANPLVNGETLNVNQKDAAGNVSPSVTQPAPDLTPPAALTQVAINADGLTVTGHGEPGATVRVYSADHTVLGSGVVASNGAFSLTLSTAQLNAQVLTVNQEDPPGNVSVPVDIIAVDRTPPATPTDLVLNGAGLQLTGHAEAGSTVTVTSAQGVALGTITTGSDGVFHVTLTSAQTNGQTLTVTATDAAGNISGPATTTAADTTAPLAVSNLAVSADGATLAGLGEANAVVTVRDAGGTLLGTGTVASNGSFSLTLNPAATPGEALSVIQTDAASNASPSATVTAPGTLAEAAPDNLVLSANGLTLTGTASIGSTVTVHSASGATLGSAAVNSDGTFSITLSSPQLNGQPLLATATSSDGIASLPTTLLAADVTAPAPLTDLHLAATGATLTGHGEAGATVTVLGQGGVILGSVVVASDSSFSVTLTPAQINGQTLTLSQTDPAGNESNSVNLTAPDLVAPTVPTGLVVSSDGLILSGTGEAGATVRVVSTGGAVVGTGTVLLDGSFQVALTTPQANGQTLAVTLTDAAGNTSTAANVTAADTTAPTVLTQLAIASDGATITGQGEAGATVTVSDANGTALGSIVVGSTGTFTLVLGTALTNAEVLTLVQKDVAGNVSPSATLVTPDFTPPAPLANVDINAAGVVVTGTGEAGATVTVKSAAGVVLGSGVVLADGSFSVTLSTPQINREPLTVQQADPPGNVSTPVVVNAPDLTPPAAPTQLQFNAAGTVVSGSGEAGATVTIRLAGTQIGTGLVDNTGHFLITLSNNATLTNGQAVSVTLTDGASNTSAAGTLLAPDTTAPNPVQGLALSASGLVLTGTGEVGATVTVTNSTGTVLGTGTVAANGGFSVTLTAAQLNGQVLSVVQQDVAGNIATATPLTAADVTAPLAPVVLSETSNGLTLTGTGEANATLTVTSATGTLLGTTTVNTDGTFSVTLSSAQLNGQVLTVVQTDGANNHGAALQYTALDTTLPANVQNLAVSTNGLLLTGTGEAGATVHVSVGGSEVGTALVAVDGTFSFTLPTALLNGQPVSVTQVDPANNASTAVIVNAPDTTAPAQPIVDSLTNSGATLNGRAEIGSVITVTNAAGTQVGTGTTDGNGVFQITLSPVQNNGQVLSVVATDGANNHSVALVYVTADTLAPTAATDLSISADHSVLAGRGEVNASVVVTNASNTVVGNGTVGANGTFTINLASGIASNAVLTVKLTDAAGNVSGGADLTVPVNPAPDAPANLVLAADGLTLTGVATASSTITVYNAAGSVLGTTTTPGSGVFTLTLNTAQTNGQTLSVTATTTLGGASLPSAVVAADTSAPDPLNSLVVNGAGLLVTGHGEVGATVTLTSSTGAALGTGIVGASGTFSITLGTALTNGQLINAVQADAAGNVSSNATVNAPDTTPPAAPTLLVLNGTGLLLSGSGESGATVTVRDAAGNVLGSGLVVNGSFAVALNSAQTNGQTLTVSQADGAGNVSTNATLTAADTTPPAALSNLALSASGLQVTGVGEAGATVTVSSGSTTLGTAVVNAAGAFTVTLSSAQLNGQALSIKQADAAGNVSPIASLTAGDTQAPAAPTGVALAANGLTLTGSGEIGATVTVTNAAGTTLGTGIVGVGGTFTVTLTTAQLDGQVLTVRLADLATNVSAGTSVTAPDTTAPGVPTGVSVNASGTLVTGTGVAGSTVKVLSGSTVLGTGTVAANGTFSVAIAAQINSQVLSVTQADPSGNVSVAATATAPDLTPPAAATGLAVTSNGLTLSGSGEAGSTVTVKAASGTVLGTATVGSGGTFSVTLSSAQNHGETLTVNLADARGNVSSAATLTVPNIDANIPLVASNDLAVATVNITPVTSTSHAADTFTTLLSGFSKTYTFTVGAGTSVIPTLTLTASSLVSLLNGVVYTLQVKNASGTWVTLDINGNGGLLDLLTLGSQQVQAKIGSLLAGDYRLVVSSTGIGVLTTVTTDFAAQTTSLTQFTGAAGAVTTGNVITDIGTSGVADSLGPNNSAVLQISKASNWVTAASGAGTTVQGLYGTLVIHADGSYTYTPNGSVTSVGQVDTFNYQLLLANGTAATATLYVRIDSPQATEVWSNTNLASPATLVDATYDVANTSITLAAKEVTTTTTLGTLATLVGGGSATYTTTVAANTVTDLTITLNASNLLSVAGSLTVTISKLNVSTGQYVVVKTVGGGALVGIGGGNYTVNVDDQTAGTYQVKVVLGGLAVATSITTSVTAAATYTNQNVVSTYTPVTGNLLTDTAGGGADVLGSAYTVLSVLLAGNYVVPGYNGTTLTGTYGTLLVHADGSYVYTLNAGSTDAVIGHSDVFTYELTHPNGTTDISTLTVNLNQAGAVTTFSALALVSDDTTAATATVAATTEVIQGTSGNDTLDAGHGGAVTLNGGAGNDTLIVHDQNFTSVDGGTGTDTLVWGGGDATIDLSTLASRIHNIEILDLNTTSAVNLTLTLSDLIAVTETGTDKLIIKGDSNDTVHMAGSTWVADASEQSGGVNYTQYTPQEDPSHHLWVQSGVHVV
ncbi:BapA/Bap/LapF family large adhesin [Pseudomonas putida]